MARSIIISASQIAVALARIAAYSLAVLKIGTVGDNSSLLLVIGYFPFLAFVDVLVQAYSRAVHVHAGGVPTIILRSRRYVAGALLTVIILTFVFALHRNTLGAVSALLIGTYFAGGLAYFWEKWTAYRERQLWLSLLEFSIISGSVLSFYFFGHQIVILMLCLISFPLARLTLLTSPGEDPPDIERTGSAKAGVSVYVIFSLSQQVVGAVSSSLPSIVGQLRGDYSNLAANLVAFRLMHSISATASLVINAMGATLFYGTPGGGFNVFERHFVEKSNWFGAAMIVLLLCSLAIAYTLPTWGIVACAPLVLILIFINFESSLSMNRGLPKSSFLCQILVLAISAALISIIDHSIKYFFLVVILVMMIYAPVHNAIFTAHIRRLQQDPAFPI